MSINSIGFNNSLFGQAVQNLNNQLTNLSTQLATGEKSTTYSGMGLNEGFAIAARSQLSNISAFTTTITNVNTSISAANTALQSLSSIAGTVQSDAQTTPQNLNSTGQTIGQQNALTELSSVVGILNTQAGDRYLFSGSAINTPAVADADTILNGNGTQAGLKQLIAERAQADGTTGLGRLLISTPATSAGPPATTSFSVAEDAAGSPFGLKLSSVTSNLTGTTVTGPSGSPASVSFSFGSTNPNPGDQVTLNIVPDVDGLEHDASARQYLCDRLNAGPDRGQSQRCVEHGNRQGGEHGPGRGFGGRRRQRLLRSIQQCDRQRRQQSAVAGSADHEFDVAFGHRSVGFAHHRFSEWRLHHRQRHADHVLDVFADFADRPELQHQPDHRQRRQFAFGDRLDHRHHDAFEHRRRRGHDQYA